MKRDHEHENEHSARELAGSAADTLDTLASWITGRRHRRDGLNELLSWVTGRKHRGNAAEELGSWITGKKRR
jgi:hypothetical protein